MAKLDIYDGNSYETPYADSEAFKQGFNDLFSASAGAHSDSLQNRNIEAGWLTSAGDQFKSQFQNLVGRDPTPEEINTFFKQSGNSLTANEGGNFYKDSANVSNQIQQYVGQNYRQAAQDEATKKLQSQQGQANSLADLFRQQGTSALDAYHNQSTQGISDTEKSLLDYQSKLFDRLRPNLLTSLKAQGLLDTGGMNEAVAGVQGDLANNASNYIAQLVQQQSQQEAQMRLQNEQGANQIAFGGQAAPYQYQQGNITGNPSYMDQMTGNATNFNNSTFMDNLNFQHQLQMAAYQQNLTMASQPGMMRTFTQGFASNPFASANSSASAYSSVNNSNKGADNSGEGGGNLVQKYI